MDSKKLDGINATLLAKRSQSSHTAFYESFHLMYWPFPVVSILIPNFRYSVAVATCLKHDKLTRRLTY